MSAPVWLELIVKLVEHFRAEGKLTRVGFWKSRDEPNLPHPREFVDETWPSAERVPFLRYLVEKGTARESCFGWSECRFGCGPNGSRDMTDGTFLWPEGYIHYVRDHKVKPPQAFIDHAKRRAGF